MSSEEKLVLVMRPSPSLKEELMGISKAKELEETCMCCFRFRRITVTTTHAMTATKPNVPAVPAPASTGSIEDEDVVDGVSNSPSVQFARDDDPEADIKLLGYGMHSETNAAPVWFE